MFFQSVTERINIPVWLGEVVDGGVVRARRVELDPQRGDVLRLVHEVVQPGGRREGMVARMRMETKFSNQIT